MVAGLLFQYGTTALQATATLVAMASEKNIWRLKLIKVANWQPTDYKTYLEN